MIYEECEGKSLSEAKIKAEELCRREPDATVVHTKTENISSMMGFKKEVIYKIIVAIPEYDHLGGRHREGARERELRPTPPRDAKLTAVEQEIIKKRSRQAENDAANPRLFAERISSIAEKVSLFEKQGAAPTASAPRASKKTADSFALPFAETPSSQLDEALSLKGEIRELKKILLGKSMETVPANLSEEIKKEQALPDECEIYRQHLRWTEHFLTEREFSRYFIDAFIKEIEKDLSVLTNKNLIIAKAKDFLKSHIPVTPINLDNYAYGDTIAMIGPTGVGKTSTLAKFAAHFGFTRKKTLRFLSVDRYKVGGESQLEKYAGLMKARFTTVTRQDEFKALIAAKEADFTFIDTAGKSPSETTAISDLAQWLENTGFPLDIHLVVSATTKNADLDYICTAYECTRYKHIIVTKLDEACSYGSVLSMAFKTQKPFSFFTDGQEIPQDFSICDLNKIISKSLD